MICKINYPSDECRTISYFLNKPVVIGMTVKKNSVFYYSGASCKKNDYQMIIGLY